VTLKGEENAFSPSFLFAARLKPARSSTLNRFDPTAVAGMLLAHTGRLESVE
jgi:hypothetical protein